MCGRWPVLHFPRGEGNPPDARVKLGAVLGLPTLPSGIARPRRHPETRFSLEAPPLQSPVSNRLAAVGGLRDACGSRGGSNSGGFPLGIRAFGHRLRALTHSRAPRRATVFGMVQIRLSRLCVLSLVRSSCCCGVRLASSGLLRSRFLSCLGISVNFLQLYIIKHYCHTVNQLDPILP